jgi:hypothetical protein
VTSPDYHNADVTNSAFLKELARGANKGAVLWTTAFHGDPEGNPGWRGDIWEGRDREAHVDAYGERNAYFSTASLRPTEEGIFRRKANLDRLLALVVDDPDVTEMLATPSWVLETSPGKVQVGFFLDREDPACADERTVTALVTRLAAKGLIGGDKSGNNIVRYVRLPVGQNQKPRDSGHWQCRLRTYTPGARYTLEDAAGALGIDLTTLLAEAATQPAGSGAFTGEQSDKLQAAIESILTGNTLHDAINTVAASWVATGMHPGAAVNTIRALMANSTAPHDHRWQTRYDDIPRAVQSAVQKFAEPVADPQTGEVLNEPLFSLIGELLVDIQPIQFVVENYLEKNALSVVFSPPGVGKTFLTVDLQCCVATGTPWHGAPVQQGAVFAIIGEGRNGYSRRNAAWAVHNEKKDELMAAPLHVSRHSVRLSDADAGQKLAAEIDRMVAACGQPPVLVTIDTLARNFGDGDENSTKDMSRFIANVDMYLVKRYQCHVMIVHHSVLDGERARGSGALKGAIDQEFQVSGSGEDGRLLLHCKKMKDAARPADMRFKIQGVKIGHDRAGNEIDGACVVLDGDALDFEVGTNKDQKSIKAADVVKAFVDGRGGSQAELGDVLAIGQSTAGRIVQKLAKSSLLVKQGRWWALSDEAIGLCRSRLWITE